MKKHFIAPLIAVALSASALIANSRFATVYYRTTMPNDTACKCDVQVTANCGENQGRCSILTGTNTYYISKRVDNGPCVCAKKL